VPALTWFPSFTKSLRSTLAGVGANLLNGRCGPIPIPVLAIALGAGLGLGGVATVAPTSSGLEDLVGATLAITLLADGLDVDPKLLCSRWGPTARALGIAMPLTMGIVAVGAWALFPAFGWAGALVLGAVLSPTDPVVTSTIITSPGVPAPVRHTLNLESGLNDALAQPYVAFFVLVATVAPSGWSGTADALELAGRSLMGVALGVVLGVIGRRVLLNPVLIRAHWTVTSVVALCVGMAALGLTWLATGNGLLAIFVAGITLAAAREYRGAPDRRLPQGLGQVLQAATFTLTGVLLATTTWTINPWAVVGLVALTVVGARPLSIGASFLGTKMDRGERIFIAWFGPKAVASLLYALMVLHSAVPDGHLVYQLTLFVVLASVLAHGLTDRLGASWMSRSKP